MTRPQDYSREDPGTRNLRTSRRQWQLLGCNVANMLQGSQLEEHSTRLPVLLFGPGLSHVTSFIIVRTWVARFVSLIILG
jgi:hypothetical protein